MRYCRDTCAVEMSAAELCAVAHKSGSLDARYPYRVLRENEKTGVMLRNTVTYHGITFTVTGYADAVNEENGIWSVTLEKPEKARATQDQYSRLRCLGHFLCAARGLREVKLILQNGKEKKSDAISVATAAQLHAFYESVLARAERAARLEITRREDRIPTAADVAFPYAEAREGQAELAQTTFRTVKKGGRLFAQAPTGIGKTMSVLYPAVRALGEGYCSRIFYLTARAEVRSEAFAAAGKLFAAGAKLRTAVLYAKEQMCLREGGCRREGNSCCNPADCPFARGYFDRADKAVDDLLARQNGFPRTTIMEVASRHRVCPYELSLDLSEQCEILICDYNYVFDPAVYLRRYFGEEGERGDYVFLIDEAHNLPDRARNMYSQELHGAMFEGLYARMDAVADAELEAVFGGFIAVWRRLAALCTEGRERHEDGTESGYYLNRAPMGTLWREFADFKTRLGTFLRSHPDHPLYEELSAVDAELRRYLALTEYYDERFLTWLMLEHGALTLKIYCLDPAGVLDACMARARASVLFSATLTPLDYFADVLGGGRRAAVLDLPSPFPPENLCVTVASGVSTRFEDRAKSYKKVASLIAATVSAKAGNYMVYFPSYEYLENVLQRFRARYPGVTCVVQQKNMRPAERDAFLAAFQADEGVLRVGFCVLGGGFSEGVDLPGSRLIGAVVVGVGIPGLSNERNILRDYFENKCERGYDYAYTYPGMIRVLQAAGRVIRGETDRGVVVLIDDRWAQEPYLHLFPSHWQGIVAAGDAASLARRLQIFWQNASQKRKN